ncbi:MAG: MlaD family protein [Candidatus Omnitrophota bacterium]
MIRQKNNLEVKVGIFVFIGIIILTIIVFSIGGKNFFRVGYTIKILFNFANGLEVGAPVRVAGVSVGEVKEIFIKNEPQAGTTKVEVYTWLEQDIKVQADAKVYINTLGLLGEKYVEIIPGENNQNLLKENDVLIGQDPVSIENVTEKALDVIKKFDTAMEYVNSLLKDEKFKQDVRDAFANVQESTKSAKNILSKIEKGEGTIGKLLVDEGLYKQLEDFIQDIKRHPWKLLVKTKEESPKKGK